VICPKKKENVDANARNLNNPSHVADIENRRRKRTTSQRRIHDPLQEVPLQQEPSSSRTGQMHVEQEIQGIQGLLLQIDFWQAQSGVQTMPQILCRVRRVCEWGQGVRRQLTVWGDAEEREITKMTNQYTQFQTQTRIA
jgi:hypothetical protein